MYQILLNSLLYFQRYALDKSFMAEKKKASYSVSTVTVLAFYNFPHSPLSGY